MLEESQPETYQQEQESFEPRQDNNAPEHSQNQGTASQTQDGAEARIALRKNRIEATRLARSKPKNQADGNRN